MKTRQQVWQGLVGALMMASAALAQGQAAAPVRIGLDAEFSHLTSTADDAIRMGMLTAIDEINGAGGVLGGRKLELVERDNHSVPARGRVNFEELAGLQDLVAVFVSKFSPVALEQAPLANALRLPLLDPWAAADDIISDPPAGTYTFRLSLRDSWAIPALLRHLQGRGFERVGVMLPLSGWGRSNERMVERHRASGAKPAIAGIEWYNWGTKSIAPLYDKLVVARSQAILFVGNEGEASLLVKEIAGRPAATRLPVASHWGVAGGDFVQLAGTSLEAVDFTIVQTFTFHGRRDARSAAVVARAAKLFNLKGAEQVPSHVGFAHAYDLTHILARAVALAGGTDRGKVRDALEQVRNYEGLMGRFAQPFSATSHEALSPAYLFIGRFNAAGTVVPFTR